MGVAVKAKAICNSKLGGSKENVYLGVLSFFLSLRSAIVLN